MEGYKLIAAVLPKGSTGKVMDAAREAGAEGGRSSWPAGRGSTRREGSLAFL